MRVWLPLVRTATGSETYTRRLAKELAFRGHEVQLDVVPHLFQYAPWLAPIRPPAETDVALTNSWNAHAFQRHGVPMVSVCHLIVHEPGFEPFKTFAQKCFHQGFVKPMERAALRHATINVAVSETVRRQMLQYLGPADIEVVLNGVDTEFFKPKDSAKSEPIGRLRLLFVGKPSRRKGFDLVAQILDRLGNRVAFTCAGEFPSAGLPIPEGNYTGYLSEAELRDVYRNSDLLLFPSRLEGCPLVVAEAMACGIPVLGCVNTAVSEIMPKDGGGITREANDIDGFSNAILDLAEDVDKIRHMQKAVRAHAVKHLSKERWVENTETLLQRAATLL